MKARFLLWPAAVALLVLCARVLAYAVAPSPLARALGRSAGGPGLVTVTLVSLGIASIGSILVVWLASLGVRERARLRPERVAPRLRLRRLAIRAVALYVASSLAFATFESYLHWRDPVPRRAGARRRGAGGGRRPHLRLDARGRARPAPTALRPATRIARSRVAAGPHLPRRAPSARSLTGPAAPGLTR